MNEFKKLTKGTIVYLFGTVGSKLVSFLLLPLYTSYISPEAYGTYDVNITYATLFSSFFFLDIWTGIMRFMFEKKDEEEKAKVVYSGIGLFLVSTLLYFCTFFLFGSWKKMEYVWGVGPYGFCLCLQNLYGYLARAYGWNFFFAVSGIVSTLCNALLNVLLIVGFHTDYKALYISFTAGIVVQCLMLEGKIRLVQKFRKELVDRTEARQLLRFALPLCVNSLCYWLLTGYNRTVIHEQLSDSVNGYYAIAARFGGILTIVASCFTMAWQELAYSKYEKNAQTGAFYSQATNVYLQVLIWGYMLIVPAISIVFPFLVAESYEPAKALIPLNMLATFAGIVYTFLGNIIATFKRNDIVFLSTLCACAVNMAVLHGLIGMWGAEAANIALLAGYVVSDAIRIGIIKGEIPYQLEKKNFLIGSVLIAVTVYGYLRGNTIWNLVWIAAGMVIGLVYCRRYVWSMVREKMQIKE